MNPLRYPSRAGALLVGILFMTALADRAIAETPPSSAADWMVVTEIFQGDDATPVEAHEIALRGGVYYDFPTAPDQPWTIFDLPRSRIILLDRQRELRTSVPIEDLIHLAARAEAEVTDAVHRKRFGMDAVPTQTGDLRFALEYEGTQYEVTGRRFDDTAIAIQYGRFVDWACRLNIARPRGVPPFARIKLNELMIRNNALPKRTLVTLTRRIGSEGVPAKIRLRSATSVPAEISAGLADRIKDAQTMRVVFQDIPWDQYEH